MKQALKTIFLLAVIGMMYYWLLMVADEVRRAGVPTMGDLRDVAIFAFLIYLATKELRRGYDA